MFSDDMLSKLARIEKELKDSSEHVFIAQTMVAIQQYIKETKCKIPFEDWSLDYIFEILRKNKKI